MADAERIPQSLWAGDGPPPKQDQVLAQVADFLGKLGYDKTLKALKKEGDTHGVHVDATATPAAGLGLLDMWISAAPTNQDSSSGSSDSESESASDTSDSDEEPKQEPGNDQMVDDEAEETSDDSSDEDSSSSETEAVRAGQKRKRAHSSSSSSSEEDSSTSSASDSGSNDDSSSSSPSDSDSDSASSESSRVRPAKRAKVGKESDDSSDSSSGSSTSSSDSDPEHKKTVSKKKANAKSDSSSSSASESDDIGSDSSDSKRNVNNDKSGKSTKKTSKKSHAPTSVVKPALENGHTDSSTSSRTIGADSPVPKAEEAQEELVVPVTTNGSMHPDRVKRLPATQENIKQLKKGNVPFQRVPTNTQVDPRFSSNEYVSYDYADRAYRDLVITKGKGFTKEKNKKKRGSYRGGAIDLAPKAIKFED